MKTISIAGLGPGDLNQIPLGVYQRIMEAKEIYVRTKDHPAVQELIDLGITVHSFDAVYEEMNEEFERIYPEIVRQLRQKSEIKNLIYAVPGHPMVAEKSVQLLLESDAEVEVLGGKSFIDDLFGAVQVDPVDGFQLVDAFDLHQDSLHLDQHIIIMQVFSPFIASEVKLTLMEKYSDHHKVCVIDAAGSFNQKIQWVKLYELDHFDGVHNLRSVYVPPVERDLNTKTFETLQYYMDEIISKDLWINEQSHESLIAYLKEESQELEQALSNEDIDNTIEELGDILLQVFYHTSLAERDGIFSLEEVLDTVNRKLRRRHPHVFDGEKADTIEEINEIWERVKSEEKGES